MQAQQTFGMAEILDLMHARNFNVTLDRTAAEETPFLCISNLDVPALEQHRRMSPEAVLKQHIPGEVKQACSPACHLVPYLCCMGLLRSYALLSLSGPPVLATAVRKLDRLGH